MDLCFYVCVCAGISVRVRRYCDFKIVYKYLLVRALM